MVMHASVQIGDSSLMLSQASPHFGTQSAKELGGSPASLHLYVPDADATHQRALEAGCKEIAAPMDCFWGERMGKVSGMLGSEPANDRPRILLHAVSVGEVNALRPLVPLLLEHATVIVCTTTDTGLARARQLFGETCEVVRYPLDFSWAVRQFLDAVRAIG